MTGASTLEQRSAVRVTEWVVPALGLFSSFVVLGVLWRQQGLVESRPDPYWFSAMAESLLNGEGFSKYGALLHRRTPGYPLFIAAIYALFGVHVIAVQLAQCLMFAGTCWFVKDIGARLFNQRTGLLAGVLCAFHPALLRYVPDLHLETLLTFLFTLSIWLSCRFFQEPKLRFGVSLGVIWGVATLTKAVVLLYPGIFAVLWFLRSAHARQTAAGAPWLTRLKPLILVFAAMGLTIAPWTVRNYVVTGKFVLITTGASDAVLRSYVFTRPEFITLQKPPYTDAENEVNAEFRALCASQGAVWEADDLQTDKILSVEAKRRVLADPARYIKKSVIGLATFWYQTTSLANSLAAGGMALVAWAFAIVGLRRAWQEGREAWLVLAPIVYLNVFLAALLSLGRYSIPVMPCLLTLSAFGIDTLLARFRGKAQHDASGVAAG